MFAILLSYIIFWEKPNGKFNREPEPLPANIRELKKSVLKYKADIGFAQDADADRLAIVNEKGESIDTNDIKNKEKDTDAKEN